jgi:hypothetical protein
MKIGLVGEAPNDTQSIKNLLLKKYTDTSYEFVFMLQRINGSSLDSQKTKRLLRIEFELQKLNFVIFIRDLDSTLPNKSKLDGRKIYFNNSNNIVDKRGIHLLHIYEIEALILADIETFNKIYKTQIKKFEDVMKVKEPKELLKKASKNYNESHNPEIFDKLNFNKVLECNYFENFIKKNGQTILIICSYTVKKQTIFIHPT